MVQVRAKHFAVELSGDVKSTIAHHFGLHPPRWGSPKVTIVRIDFHVLNRRCGSELVRPRRHNQPMKMLHRPRTGRTFTVYWLDKFSRQPIEQRLIDGGRSAQPKIKDTG